MVELGEGGEVLYLSNVRIGIGDINNKNRKKKERKKLKRKKKN